MLFAGGDVGGTSGVERQHDQYRRHREQHDELDARDLIEQLLACENADHWPTPSGILLLAPVAPRATSSIVVSGFRYRTRPSGLALADTQSSCSPFLYFEALKVPAGVVIDSSAPFCQPCGNAAVSLPFGGRRDRK